MAEPTRYYVVKKKAVPEVLLKVVEAKRLLESEKVATIQDAVDAVGISRSSFINIRTTYSRFMTTRREGRSPFPCRSKMNRAFCRMCSR